MPGFIDEVKEAWKRFFEKNKEKPKKYSQLYPRRKEALTIKSNLNLEVDINGRGVRKTRKKAS